MSIKHIIAGLLLLALLCGTASATATTLTVNVYDNSAGNDPIQDAKVVITSSGLDQTIYTNSDGTARFASVEYKSTYTVKITKDNYESQQLSLYINTMDKNYAVYLQKSNMVQIKVQDPDKSTVVSGADVKVDGRSVGSTNSAGIIHVSMEKGSYHDIEVSADSYETYTTSQYIDTDQTSLVLTLSKSYYSPLILVYDPDKKPVSGATISIDGKIMGNTDSYGRAQLSKLTAGTYKLSVTKENFVTYDKTVTFSEEEATVTVDMVLDTVPVTIFTVDGTTPVSTAFISIDGTMIGFTDTTGKYETRLTPGKTVLINASKDGYTGSGYSYQVTSSGDHTVMLPLSPAVPYALIGGIVLGIIVILIVALLLKGNGRKRSGRGGNGGSPKSGGRNSL